MLPHHEVNALEAHRRAQLPAIAFPQQADSACLGASPRLVAGYGFGF